MSLNGALLPGSGNSVAEIKYRDIWIDCPDCNIETQNNCQTCAGYGGWWEEEAY